MTKPVYTFDAQLIVGEEGEAYLDRVMSHFGTIEKVQMDEQWKGIDRHMIRPDFSVVTLEYKTDTRCVKTGNVFLETMSNAGTGRLGWAFTTQADRLVWYLPGVPTPVVIVPPNRIRVNLAHWSRAYREISIRNPTFVGKGIAVPLPHILAIAATVLTQDTLDFILKEDSHAEVIRDSTGDGEGT